MKLCVNRGNHNRGQSFEAMSRLDMKHPHRPILTRHRPRYRSTRLAITHGSRWAVPDTVPYHHLGVAVLTSVVWPPFVDDGCVVNLERTKLVPVRSRNLGLRQEAKKKRDECALSTEVYTQTIVLRSELERRRLDI